jgi:hypothetical protein
MEVLIENCLLSNKTMAYSMYVYLKPEIVDAGIPYWDNYFANNPWLKVPQPGDDNLFIHVKPRLENGTDRLTAFMEGVKAAGDFVVELHADVWNNPTPAQIKDYLVKCGYSEYVDRFVFE